MTTSNVLDELLEATTELSRKTDQLNSIIEKLEDVLDTANVGVCAWTLLLLNDEVSGADNWLLGYVKVKGKWRIAVRRAGFETLDGASPSIPLANAPRLIRFAAASHLKSLVSALVHKTVEYIADINNLQKFEIGAECPKT